MPTPILKADKSGTYYAHWSDDRRSKRKSMGTASRAEAEARFAHWLLLRHTLDATTNTRVFTVGDCWTVYAAKRLPLVAAQDTALLTWANLKTHFDAMLVSEVDQAAVDAYVRKRTTGKLGRKVQPQTCRRELATLVAVLNFCGAPAQKMLDPKTLPVIELPPSAEPRDRWLRMHEMQALLTAAREMRVGDRLSRGERFLRIALETGARLQAILELTWDRVDFDTGVIHFDVPGRQKTKKRRAAVPISATLRPVLLRAHGERINDLVMDNQGAIWATVQRIAIRAGLGGAAEMGSDKPRATGISPHVLRHSAATHMARNGVPLFTIAKVLGNSYQMVEKVYAKWCPDDPAGTVDMISNGVLETTE